MSHIIDGSHVRFTLSDDGVPGLACESLRARTKRLLADASTDALRRHRQGTLALTENLSNAERFEVEEVAAAIEELIASRQ